LSIHRLMASPSITSMKICPLAMVFR